MLEDQATFISKMRVTLLANDVVTCKEQFLKGGKAYYVTHKYCYFTHAQRDGLG